MNHLTPEERAKIFETAQEMDEALGGGVERWMVLLQQAQASWAYYLEAVEAIGDAVCALVEGMAPSINQLARMIQDLSDRLEAPPHQPLCPSHRTPLKGGRCTQCDKVRYMVSQRPQSLRSR
jgi:hypothetical protein